ncbi:sensor histidine kinase [Candidatus Magnetominusculus xianensis]|uniref:histidine kinase n=1 Tax=Candidatus Magnetominusculus xianensis TaxID=1748249 RepID=A0ABR5SK18_9BACT|nr:histidine kinase dimerization/phosphoacceptor domain -containing protein [Candidatus Magnetominusculus xianensis]KWT86736.1 putative sensor histidine kinase [Candidatus Magnetominusculus xianensis]MBF0402545.1 PAS domain S-box protein [Nitrospirota bacterium]
MKNTNRRFFSLRVALAYAAVCLLTAGITYVRTEDVEIQALHKSTMERLMLFDRYVTAKTGYYNVHAKILSQNPIIAGFLMHPAEDNNMNDYLLEFNDSIGANVTYVLNKDGLTIASSNYKSPKSFLGKNYGFREYFRNALKGKPDVYITIGVTQNTPGYYTSYPVRSGGGDIVGVVAIKYFLDIFQDDDPNLDGIMDGIMLLTDNNSVIFASNHERYRFNTIRKLPEQIRQQIKEANQYASEPLPPLPIIDTKTKDNLTLVILRLTDKHEKYLLETAHEKDDDWHIYMLAGLTKVYNKIIFNCLYAILIVTVIFLVLILISRMALDLKRRAEYEKSIKSINEGLELEVKKRTQELQTTVDKLVLADKSLHESETKYRQLVELSQEGIWVVNKVGVTTYVNHAVADMLGFTVGEMTGVRFAAFMADDAKERAANVVNYEQGAGKADRLETTLLHKDGSSVYVSISTVALTDEQGNYTGSFAVISDITKRKQTEEKLMEAISEQELLLRELHHRVKNNLQIIAGLVGLQISHVSDEGYKNILKDTQSRIQSISLVHEKLYNTEKLSQVNIKEYIYSLVKDLFIFFTVDRDKINVNFEVPDIHVGIDTAIPCGLIINELFTNIIKYAFKGRDRGEISIRLSETGLDMLELIIGDNGVGMPEGIDIGKTKSLGLKVVTILSKQLRGTVEIDRGGGTRFILRFKRSEVTEPAAK